MLRTIPRRILTNTASLKVPSSTDKYGKAVYTTYQLEKVHIQPTHSITKNREDKDVKLNAVLFYDVRISKPTLDFSALQEQSDIANAQMKVVIGSLTYTVVSIDLLPDDEGKPHHVEVNLI